MMRLARKIPRACGFMLLELLVVVVILGILAALGFSGAQAALRKGGATECVSNMRQIASAVQLYAVENNGNLPDIQHGGRISWTNALGDFLGPQFIGRCPSLKNYPLAIDVTYAWNDMLADPATARGIPLTKIARPSSTLLIAEKQASLGDFDHFHFRGALGARGRMSIVQFEREVNTKAHGASANFLFADGHVESLGSVQLQSRLSISNPPFLVP